VRIIITMPNNTDEICKAAASGDIEYVNAHWIKTDFAMHDAVFEATITSDDPAAMKVFIACLGKITQHCQVLTCVLNLVCKHGKENYLKAYSDYVDAGPEHLSFMPPDTQCLHNAAKFGHMNLVKILLSDYEFIGSMMGHAIDVAHNSGHPEIRDFLIKTAKDQSIPTEEMIRYGVGGTTPSYFATSVEEVSV
jgi:hypothetical protein